MAVTSPDNIRTPDSGDQYALVQDLGVLADSTQAAITKRGNLFAGTAAQRTAFTTATNGINWQDTDGIRMIWRRVAGAWVPATWRWSGTAAEMAAFTQAPTGFSWFNTTDNSEYTRLAGAWNQSGAGKSWSTTITATNSGTTARVLATINTGSTTIPAGTMVTVNVRGVGVYNNAAGTTGSADFRYTANGAAVTTASALIPVGATRRFSNVSGNVTTYDMTARFAMPTSGILTVGLTTVAGATTINTYSDPWSFDLAI